MPQEFYLGVHDVVLGPSFGTAANVFDLYGNDHETLTLAEESDVGLVQDQVTANTAEITDLNNDVANLFTGIGNETTARVNYDNILQTNIDIISQRIDNLLYDPVSSLDVLNGSREYLNEFVEVFSEDQIDGLTQRFAFFTNALSGKLSDIDANLGTGLTIDKSNPAFPVFTQNRPFWVNIQSKPTLFPPTAHTHPQADITGLAISLSLKENKSEKGIASGYAGLGVDGKVPASQLPPAGSVISSTDNLPEGLTNFYFTIARVWGTVLTGLLVSSSGVILATDSLLDAFGKLQNQITNIAVAVRATILTGFSAAISTTVLATDTLLVGIGKLQGQMNFGIANFALMVRATVLTGLSVATGGAITAADSVLVAFGKLQNQITNIGGGSVPVGTVIEIALASAPTGFLLCDGSQLLRTTYSVLFASIGTVYGAGNVSGNFFNIPDRRGNVGRGAGTSAGYIQNVTITLGTKTDDAIQSHNHNYIDSYFASQGGAAVSGAPFYGIHDTVTRTTDNQNQRAANETRVKSLGMNYAIKF